MKRAIVGHVDAAVRVDELHAAEIGEAGISSTEIWLTNSTPPDLTSDITRVRGKWTLEPPSAGTVFRLITFAPGATAGTHATRTLDYLVVVSGEISLLVGAEEITLQGGDAVVVNGAHHGWANRSDSPCVLAAILVSAT